MANKRGRKPTNNKSSVKIDNQLNDKLNNYCAVTGSTKTDIVNNLLRGFFNNKIVSNDYITLDKPFYFNMNDLKENKEIKATQKQPLTDKENIYIINKIPNNLDSFNKEFKSYCFDDIKCNHRGIFIKPNIMFDNKGNYNGQINYLITAYDYDVINNSLTIGLLENKHLDLYLTIEKRKYYYIYSKEKSILKNMLETLNNNQVIIISRSINKTDILKPYTDNYKKQLLKQLNKAPINKKTINYSFNNAIFNNGLSIKCFVNELN